jgi:hypothetical protein
MHADRNQKIEDLIGVEEGIYKLATLANKGTYTVGEQAVKAHAFEAEFFMATLELPLPIRA